MTSEPTTTGTDQLRRCPRCGETFGCGASRGPGGSCWCGGVTLTPATTTRLAVTFDGCLCPTCLRAEATVPADGSGGSTTPGTDSTAG